MQYAWSSRNKALITGVDKRHEPRYTAYAVFQGKREAKRGRGQALVKKVGLEQRHGLETWTARGFVDVDFSRRQK